jgi:hypothetical protein
MVSEDVVWESGDARVVVGYDDCPEPPYNDGGSPVVVAWDRGGMEQASGTSYRLPCDIVPALDHYRHNGGYGLRDWDDTLALWSRYLRIWHGVTTVEDVGVDGVRLFTFDPEDWREAMGAPAGSVDLSEWVAFHSGEVFYVASQRMVTWTSDDGRSRTEWHTVDAVHGFYGEADALTGALYYFPAPDEAGVGA